MAANPKHIISNEASNRPVSFCEAARMGS